MAFLSGWFGPSGQEPSQGQLKTLIALKTRLSTPVADAPHHEEALKQLWDQRFHEQPYQAVSKAWKEYGFQRYFCKKYVGLAKVMVDEQKPRLEVHYPWAAVGINVTRMLTDLMHISDGTFASTKKTWCAFRSLSIPFANRSILDSHPDAFDELYCLVFQLFDLTWTQRNGTYMQFGAISDATKQRLNAVLEKQPVTLRQFASLLQNECKRIVFIDQQAPVAQPPTTDANKHAGPQHVLGR